MMSPTILWLIYCLAVGDVRGDVELAGANSLNSDSSLENNANSDVVDNNRNDLEQLNRLNSDSSVGVSNGNVNIANVDSEAANRLSRNNEQDSGVTSDVNGHDNLRNLRSNTNGVAGVYDFTNRANFRNPSLIDVNGVLSGLGAVNQANSFRNGRLNVVSRSGYNDQNQVSVIDGSRLSALVALNRHGVVGNGVSGLSGLNIVEKNGLSRSRGLNGLENVIVQRSAALREVNGNQLNDVNNLNGLNGDKDSVLSAVNRWAVVSNNHLGDLLNSNLEQNLNDQGALNEVNSQSDSNGVSRSGVNGVFYNYRTGNVPGLDGISQGSLGLGNSLVNSNTDNLIKLRLGGANNNALNNVNSLLNNLQSSNLDNGLNLEHQNDLVNRIHRNRNDVANVLGSSNSNNVNLLNELSRSGLLGAANSNNQRVSLNELKEAAKLGLQEPVLLDRSRLMGRSGSGLNEVDLLNAADNHNEGNLNALSALVSLSNVNNNKNLRSALNNLINQNGQSRSSGSNSGRVSLVGGHNLHSDSNDLTSDSNVNRNSVSLNSFGSNGLNVDVDAAINSLNSPEPSNRDHAHESNEANSLDSEAKLESRLPEAEIEQENQNRRRGGYLGNGLRNLGLGYGRGWVPSRPQVVYSPYNLPNPVRRPVVTSYTPPGYRPRHPPTYIPYALRGRSGLNDDVALSNDAVDLSSVLFNINNLNDVNENLLDLNKLVDLTDYDIDNLLSLFEKSELNGVSPGRNELRNANDVSNADLVSNVDGNNVNELNNNNLNNRRIVNNIVRRLQSNLAKSSKVANNDVVNVNTNAQSGLNKLVGVDSLAVKSNSNVELEEAVNNANVNEQNLEDVQNVVANARRQFMRYG